MDDSTRSVPRRKPVSTGVQFGDFDLQPLNPAYLEHIKTRPTETAAAQTPSLEAYSRPVELEPHHASTIPHWTPFYLRRGVLQGFVVLFVSLMIVLAALYGYSQLHQGLSSASQKDYYLWTYGPTAVFTPVAAFWGQVVYRTLQLAPWEAMATKPQLASKSVSLDYISPMRPVALFEAAKNSHYRVCLALISSFVLMGVTVFSTGLFTLQYTDITMQGVALSTTNKFDLSEFDWSTVEPLPAAVVYATLDLGLGYPAGTTARYAVQDFSKAGRSNVTMEATVDTFSGYLECEPASLIVTGISEYAPMGHLFHSEATFTFDLTSPSCTVTNVTYSPPVSFDRNIPYNMTGDFTWGFAGLMDCVQEGQNRILASVGTYRADVVWTSTDIDRNLTLPWDQMFRVVNSTNIFCTPQYEIMKSRVSKISNSTSPDILGSISPLGQGSSLPGRGMDIARAVFQSIGGNADSIKQSSYANGSNYTSDLTTLDTFFTILQRERPFFGHARAASEFWFQLDNLIRETNAVYGSIAAQVAALKLLVASNGEIEGTVTTNEPRLFVRTLSFALMEAGLGLLTLFATYLLLTVSKSILRHDPGSISGMAAIVSRSPDLVGLVSNAATRPISATKAKLQERTYYTDIQHGLLRNRGIHVSERLAPGVQSKVAESDPGGSSMVWWQPFVLQKLSRLMVILTPLLYISILEILFTFSQSNDGLLGIDNNSWVHYGWTYLPALMMLYLHVLYTSVSFSIRLLAPYLTLHRGSVPALVSVVDHPLSRTALHELFGSFRRGQKAVFAITVATLLAPLLTIAVSGLYTAENYVQYAEARVLTGWNFNYAHLYPNATLVQNVFNHMNESNPAAIVMESTGPLATELIVTANLSYPKWSYEELALPVIEITSLKHDNRTFSSQSASFEVSLPAVRAALNCTAIAHENVEINYATWNSSFSEPTYNSSSKTYSYSAAYNSTLGAAKAGNLACLGLDGCRIAIFSTNSTQQLGGCSTPREVLFLPNETSGMERFGYFSPLSLDQYWNPNQTYCPLYGGMVGSMTSTQVEDYTWFVCSTSVQRITARVTFKIPDYEIVQAQADESAVSLIPGNGSMVISDGPVDVYGNLLYVTFRGPNAALMSGAQGNLVDGNTIFTFYNTSDGQNFDSFFSSLVYGRYGIPIDEMLGKANIPRLMSAVEHLWRILYAQTFRTSQEYLSADPRDIEAWTPQQPLDATLVDRNAFRLKQSEVTTRILQGLLAAISLSGIVAFWLMDTGRVLPNNPSSIAVVASLLAESEMLNITEVQAEKEEIAKLNRSRWDGYLFSLGWWERPGGTRRFGIDVGKAEKAS